MLSPVIINDRLGSTREWHIYIYIWLRDYVPWRMSGHSQRQKETDIRVTRATLKRRLCETDASIDERRGQFVLPPTIPRWHWGGREQVREARRTGCPASGWGLAFVAPTGIYLYICRGAVADTSSQPALPISKRNLGRLDIRENRSVYRTTATLGVFKRHHPDVTKS